MERIRFAGSLISGALVLWGVMAQEAKAQECVNWSVYSCKNYAPSAKPAASPQDRFPLGIISPKDEAKLDVRTLYRVDVTCNSTKLLPAAHSGIFSRTDLVTSHLVAITDQALTGTTLPTQAKALIPVYSVSTANANQANFTNRACNTSFFITGKEALFIAASTNKATSTTPSLITNLFFAGLKVFNPISPLLVGTEAAALLKPSLDAVGATQGPLKDLFAQFNKGTTQTISTPVFVGEQNIRTEYSRTRIIVTPIASVVQTDEPSFVVAYENSLTGPSDELAKGAAEDAARDLCKRDGNQLLSRNFPAYDVAYGLTYITRTSGISKEKSVACLGDLYGPLSVESFTCPSPARGLKCVWNRFPDPLTLDDFKHRYPKQQYKVVFFKGLRNAMAKYANGVSDPAETHAELTTYLEDEVDLENLDERLPGKGGKISAADLMQRLIDKGLTKFGCEAKDNQAAGLLFAFPGAPGTDGLYKPDEVVALRNWIGASGKVFKVEAFFQPGLVADVAKPTLMWCGSGLHLAGPAKDERADKAADAGGQ